MPIPSNWLEELVAEWLSLEGFAVDVLLPIHIAGGRGGRREPDVLGARINGDSGHLIIRHWEAATWPASSAEEIARTYQGKFRPEIIQLVEQHFRRSFGTAQSVVVEYQQILIFGGIANKTRAAIPLSLPDADVYTVDEFIRDAVLPAISIWKHTQPTANNPATLPADKWLLKLLEYLEDHTMLNRH